MVHKSQIYLGKTYFSDKGHNFIQKSCSKTGDGIYCAAWIRENGWKIPNGYPLK